MTQKRNEIEQVVIEAGGAAYRPKLWQKGGKNRIYLTYWSKGKCDLFIDLDSDPVEAKCFLHVHQDPRWIQREKRKILDEVQPLVEAVQAFLEGRKPFKTDEDGDPVANFMPEMN
jgi:hypothetical protein